VTATYYCDFMQKLRTRMHKNRPDLLGDGPLILHDNARPHLEKVVTDLLSKYEWEALPHAPYSPDMSPPYFDLFPKLKQPMCGHRFSYPEELSAAVTRAIRTLKKWYPQWNSKSSETLRRGHCKAGGLHRRIVKRYCLK
jgi:transposase